MEILTALGINSTIWMQLLCFMVAYTAVSQLAFKPYMAAYKERLRRTSGQEHTAEQMLSQVQTLRSEYEHKARDVNAQYKAIYDRSRTEALREYDRIVQSARDLAAQFINQNRQQIEKEVAQAQKDMVEQAPVVGGAIAARLVGKDMNA